MSLLIASGSRKITALTAVSGISGSTSMPIVMGGNTVQVSHTNFLNSTLLNQPNTFTENNIFSGNNILQGNTILFNATMNNLDVSGDIDVDGEVTATSLSGSLKFTDVINKPTLVSSSQQVLDFGIFAVLDEVNEFTIEQRITNNDSVTDLTGDGILIRNDVIGPPTFGFRISSSAEELLFQDIVAGGGGIPFNTFLRVGTNSGPISISRNTAINGNLQVNGNLIATQYIVSSSVSHITSSFSSGSTIFGDTVDDRHQFTGSVLVSGGVTAPSFTGSLSFTNLTNRPTLVSGSTQISFNGITDRPTLVSGSSQITYSGISSIPTGIVSSSTQVLNYGIFATTGSNTFRGNQTITGSLLVSGSGVFVSSVTASAFSGAFFGNGSGLTGVTAGGVDFSNILNRPTLVSGSTQISFNGIVDKPTLFSSSIQVNADTITNFDTNVKDKLNVDLVVSGSASDVKTFLSLQNVTNESKATMFSSPTFTGTVSGVTATHVGLGNVTNESKGTMFTSPSLTGTPIAPTAAENTNTTQIATTAYVQQELNGIVSGSSQISFNGIVDKPTLVSSSAQITYSGLSSIPTGIVSSSTQVLGYGIFATTGSNTFRGNQIVTGSIDVSGSGLFGGNVTILRAVGGASFIAESTATNGEATFTLTGKNSSGVVRSSILKYDNLDVLRLGTASPIPIRFETNDVGRLTIASGDGGGDGSVTVSTGNLVIGTAGKGIDFSATTNGSGTMTSELLDDYEEGTFTPTIFYTGTNTPSYYGGGQLGRYTKIGRIVQVQIYLNWDENGSTGNVSVASLPFTSFNSQPRAAASTLSLGFVGISSSVIGFTATNSTGITLMLNDNNATILTAANTGGNQDLYVTVVYEVV